MTLSEMNRREFVKAGALAAAGTCALMAGSVGSCAKQTTSPDTKYTIDVTTSQYSVLATAGGIAYVPMSDPDHPAIVFRETATTVRAMTSKCTHQQCQVGLPDANGILTCPCHGSQYDKNGNVLVGPAPASLAAIPAVLSGNAITLG